MTEQENQIFAALTEEFHLDDGKMETMLAMLGLSYGLTVDEIRSYLTGKDEFIVKKHMQMLCRILGIDDREVQKSEAKEPEKISRRDWLDRFLRQHYHVSEEKQPYEDVMQFILNDTELSAAQIEQLRLAAEAGIPGAEILKLAKGGKQPMEIKRCVEFYQLVHSKKGAGIRKRRWKK